MDFFLNRQSQAFEWNFRDSRPGATHILTQGNDVPSRFYLVNPASAPASSYPFFYDALSGKAGVTGTVSLLQNVARNDGTFYGLTLSGPTDLALIPYGFSAVLDLSTTQIAEFMTLPTRECFLALDLIDNDGHYLSVFRAYITLRLGTPDIGATPATPIPATIRLDSSTALVGFTGGGSTKVDGAAETVGKALRTLYRGVVGDTLYEWELRAGAGTSADDSNAPYQIKPTDYAALTPRILVLVGG